jgi:hypothetical protein
VGDHSMQVNHPGPDQGAINLAAVREHRHIGGRGFESPDELAFKVPPPAEVA